MKTVKNAYKCYAETESRGDVVSLRDPDEVYVGVLRVYDTPFSSARTVIAIDLTHEMAAQLADALRAMAPERRRGDRRGAR